MLFCHQDLLKLFDRSLFGLLNINMVLEIVIGRLYLLKRLKNNVGEPIFFLDDMQRFGELLFLVLSLLSLFLKDINGYFLHFNGAQLGRPGVLCVALVATGISFVVGLAFCERFSVLVELRVHVEEVNALHINFIHILAYGVARGDADVSSLMQAWIAFRLNAGLVVFSCITLNVIVYGELS